MVYYTLNTYTLRDKVLEKLYRPLNNCSLKQQFLFKITSRTIFLRCDFVLIKMKKNYKFLYFIKYFITNPFFLPKTLSLLALGRLKSVDANRFMR